MKGLDEHYKFTMDWLLQDGRRYGRIICNDKKELKQGQEYYTQRMKEDGIYDDLYHYIEWKIK